MGSGPKCDVEFLFIQDVIGTNTERVPRHAKVFKDTNKSYEKLLDDTIEGLKAVSYTHLTLPTKRIV